jgi:hypothetical protein
MRQTKIEENLESRPYAREVRARREIYCEISDLFHLAGNFPTVLVESTGSGKELIKFESYDPTIIHKIKDSKVYPAGFIVDLIAEITCPDKFRLIDIYHAKDQITIQGPTNDVRDLYSKWINN